MGSAGAAVEVELSRYDRQMRFAPIGESGQRKLEASTVLVAGVGALGSSLAQQMARAGVGRLRLVDRDFVEPDNLHRQSLYDEADAASSAPKALAAAARLRAINGAASVEPRVTDLSAANASELTAGVDLVLDGTDNVETRLLLSDACFRRGIPFAYGGATGSSASAALLVPGETACLRCLIGGEADAAPTANCDTAGIIGPAADVAAALQAVEALKWLTGNREALRRTWITADVWRFALKETRLPAARTDCPFCAPDRGAGEEPPGSRFAAAPPDTVVLCGRDTIQVATGRTVETDREAERLKERLIRRGCAIAAANRYLVRARTPEGASLAIFADGRVLVRGATEPADAWTICLKYVSEETMDEKEERVR
ncbi:thiamine biosynthesis protein ThiF [Paenibacillus antri]|uniref:Thiamine biosynthesis protein ThiF n=1 Tax=Paenibacillus antri TaxID=2582848 RepID=A0A5R9GC57_9BACL|nr:ThiF family adenylyltransferase [Paenibacillus antri]TLS51916.1 thiamine biosynthesis protein ThiF [Paenibacillus antri]